MSLNKDNREKLSPITLLLHWLVAVVIISQLTVGIYMAETASYALYPIHKSIGTLVLVFILVRVYWRIVNGLPQPVANANQRLHWLANVVHWILLVATLIMPISGILMSAVGGHGVAIFSWHIVPVNYNEITEQVVAHNETIASIMHSIHGWTGWVIIVAISLHIAGAIKHHFIDGDNTLRRMLGKRAS